MKKLLTATSVVFSFMILSNITFAQSPTPVPAPTLIPVYSIEQWGDKSMAEGKYETAIQYYSRMILVSGVVEKIAKALAKMDKPPAIPEQAEFHASKGAAFVNGAKTPADFAKAVKEFQDAVHLAPWVFDYHFNLAVAYKSAGQFKNALDSLTCAKLLAGTDEERRAVLTQRAEVEAAQEMASSANAESERINAENARQAAILAQSKRFEGSWQTSARGGDGTSIVIRRYIKHQPGGAWTFSDTSYANGQLYTSDYVPYGLSNIQVVGSELRFDSERHGVGCGIYKVRGTISDDRSVLSLAFTSPAGPPLLRCPLQQYYSSFVEKWTRQ